MERIRCFYVYQYSAFSPWFKRIQQAIRYTIPPDMQYHNKDHGDVNRGIIFADEDNGSTPAVIQWQSKNLVYFMRCESYQYEQVNRAFILAGFFKSDLPF